MKAIFRIVGKVFKVYLIATGAAWMFIGIGNYLDDAHYMCEKHGYAEKLSQRVLEVHADHALEGVGWFLKLIKNVIVDAIKGLF